MKNIFKFLLLVLLISFASYFVYNAFFLDTKIEKDEIKDIMKKMSVDEKIGQLIISSYDNTDEILPVIKDNKIGGVILYKKNIINPSQTINDINIIQNANFESKISMFISTDQEGGKVTRLPSEMGEFDSAINIGNKNDKQYAYDSGKKIGSSLAELGFNLDFAPVLDIFSNPKNNVIGERSFGTNPKIVSDMGIEVIKGLHSEKIMATAKHFPGHGDTEIDSHIGLPVVNKSISELMSFEFKPFTSAINNDVDMVMVAHIILSKVDNLPSTLSSKVVNDILRDELKYNGVVITDDMSMGAIAQNYNIADASVMAINAGCDIILVKGINNTKDIINSLKEAIEDGTLTEERIDESLYRILKLKDKYQLMKKRL